MLMILPRFALIISRPNTCEQTNGAATLSSMICSQRSSGSSSAGATQALPALLISTSTRPNFFSVASFTASTCAGSVTSAARPSAFTPSFSSPAAACSQFSALREHTTMFDPASASAVAICNPRPVAPPVTTLTRPLRSKSSFTLAMISSLRAWVVVCGSWIAIRRHAGASQSGFNDPRPTIHESRIFQQLRGDDIALDLRGALVDARDARVAEGGLDAHLAHVAHAAVDLHGGVHHLAERLGGVELGGRRFERAALAAQDGLDRAVGEQARGVAHDAHVGEHPLQALVLGDLLAALHARLHVVHALLDQLVHDAASARRDRHAAHGQRLHRLHVAHAFRAEQVVRRHLAIGEGERHRAAAVHAHLELVLADRESLEAALQDE